MGREIRRVPLGWDPPTVTHPDGTTSYVPMLDETYDQAAREWLEGCAAWEAGTHPDHMKFHPKRRYYWEWSSLPNPDYYRPEWSPDAVLGYRVYETYSLGTPVSPTFATLDELRLWLLTQGYSATAAQRFIEQGYALSAVAVRDATGNVSITLGIATLDTDT